jgi:hypothetical protein
VRNLLLLSVLAACDPVATLSGRIEPTTHNQLVELKCPPDAKLSVGRESRTDSEGSFVFEGVGCVPFDCYVSVLGARSQSVGSACSSTARGCAAQTCTEVRGLFVDIGSAVQRLK